MAKKPEEPKTEEKKEVIAEQVKTGEGKLDSKNPQEVVDGN